ncbi:MAG: hypothetical protein OK436_07065, partial [Thaumarchaeota archaeon]|nr:hypothetical protein [Nitrososphaerota archaeon]
MTEENALGPTGTGHAAGLVHDQANGLALVLHLSGGLVEFGLVELEMEGDYGMAIAVLDREAGEKAFAGGEVHLMPVVLNNLINSRERGSQGTGNSRKLQSHTYNPRD